MYMNHREIHTKKNQRQWKSNIVKPRTTGDISGMEKAQAFHRLIFTCDRFIPSITTTTKKNQIKTHIQIVAGKL